MKGKKSAVLSTMTATLMISAAVIAADETHWGYSGQQGPEHWGQLSSEFATCSTGKNQSPIDLAGMIEGDLAELVLNYTAGGGEVVNNGHTVEVTYAAGSSVIVGNRSFDLAQFHFHSPSENTIEGDSYPMEAHFVHADKDGNLAVLAVMFKAGKHNTELEKAWARMPHQAGSKLALATAVDANHFFPRDRAYYRFNGSLTTPPCSEGVNWFVMKQFATASTEQIEKFVNVIHQQNNRPLQPINARVIVQ